MYLFQNRRNNLSIGCIFFKNFRLQIYLFLSNLGPVDEFEQISLPVNSSVKTMQGLYIYFFNCPSFPQYEPPWIGISQRGCTLAYIGAPHHHDWVKCSAREFPHLWWSCSIITRVLFQGVELFCSATVVAAAATGRRPRCDIMDGVVVVALFRFSPPRKYWSGSSSVWSDRDHTWRPTFPPLRLTPTLLRILSFADAYIIVWNPFFKRTRIWFAQNWPLQGAHIPKH